MQAGEIAGWVSGEYISIETTYSYAETREAEEAKKQEQTIVQETQKVQEASAQSIVQNQAASGQAVIDYACQFIGNPYVWGGTSLTEGADCSGFVQSVYAHFGISLPRTTWDMEMWELLSAMNRHFPEISFCMTGMSDCTWETGRL